MRIDPGTGDASVADDEDGDPELIESRRIRPEPGAELCVFAYGSLMWNPDFPFLDVEPATLYGYHRAFCIESTHYRGTKERPGLVLGLDRGGMCIGRMFRVAPTHAVEAADYLHEREMVGGVYEPKWLKLRLGERKSGERGSGERRAVALGYVADRQNRHYAGKLEAAETAKRIRGAVGRKGS
ncbi:MAG TPA: gamma-glutamylcyclotransferase, partial [Dongiaceae bacterium]